LARKPAAIRAQVMTVTAAIIVAAGSGSRAGDGGPKQFRVINGKPMVGHSVEALVGHSDVSSVIVVINQDHEMIAKAALEGLDVRFVSGGATRRDSVNNGLHILDTNIDNVLIHDAARPFLPARVINDLIAALDDHHGAVPALPVIDSLSRSLDGKILSASENREGLWRIQTPQAFRLDAIKAAHAAWNPAQEATDDARMAMAAGFDVALVPGDEALTKYTFSSDFAGKSDQSIRMPAHRSGTGFDVHRLIEGEELWLCGIKLDYHKGLAGHSDADVALHALTDAVLGAAALGDIGDHFPPSDPQWRGASSDRFLAHAVRIAADAGHELANLDLTIICEAPKIGPHRPAMRARVAEIVGLPLDAVSIKATTTEMLGFTGRGEGIAAMASATLVSRT
jgi:2-C-methyl-D-erythritol 4-phosphate cytidylyltransferase / 2-C-methyl-D-erythritol 2,4-cyclodiphosphate synthase